MNRLLMNIDNSVLNLQNAIRKTKDVKLKKALEERLMNIKKESSMLYFY